MNLFALLQRGQDHAPSNADRDKAKIDAEAERASALWLQKLGTDKLRAWINIGESDGELLNGMAVMLTLAGFAHVHAVRNIDTHDVRIIRGAISAATQCATSGCLVTLDLVRGWTVAIDRAIEIVKAAPIESIIHASIEMQKTQSRLEKMC